MTRASHLTVSKLTGSNLSKAERIAYIDDKLQALYPETPVPLDHTDPYTLLIAVLLSAQCTDERVNQVTPGLFAKADCPEEMVTLSVETIRGIIRPCGLSPQKSKAIHRLSELLLAHHEGQVPADLEALEKLPGVGHKTASVVMAQAFGMPNDVQISENIHMRMLEPSVKDGDNWVDTDISNESSKVQAICNAVWTDELKAAYQEHLDSQVIGE